MNSLKNLLIVAVLAAAGYGVYVSLQRNNADPPSGKSEWGNGPKIDWSGSKSPAGGPLALSGSTARPNGAAGPQPRTVASPPLGPATTNPLAGSTGATPAVPYASTTPPTAAPTALGNSSRVNPSPSSPSPSATLGVPMPPESIAAPAASQGLTQNQGNPSANQSSAGGVRNLTPPPGDAVRNLAPPPVASTADPLKSPAAEVADNVLQAKFNGLMQAVQKKLSENKLAEAHAALSILYANPDLPPQQAKQITTLLDQLAGTVVYSREHLMEPPYVTKQGDTLDRVAQKYNVPWQLLGRINGLMPQGIPNNDAVTKDQPLPVGMELKVVRGPFDAVVRLDKRELTLMVQNRYAGRFPIGVGRDQPKLDGNYTVRDKTFNPTYYGPDGVTVNPNDPKNPLGGAWIGLTDRIGIHGTSDPRGVGRDDNRGTICVSDRDLQDLYGILSVGSRVMILR
jgi:hypothetical protein